jgi:hypothetical protein
VLVEIVSKEAFEKGDIMQSKSSTVGCLSGLMGAVFMTLINNFSFAPATAYSEETSRPKMLEQYIAAQVKLAKVELQQIEQFSGRFKNLYPKGMVERQRNHIMIKEEQLKFIQKEGRDDFVNVHNHLADANLKVAQLDLESAKSANRKMSCDVPNLEIQRLEANAEVARLHSVLAGNTKDLQSSTTLLMFQVDELTNDVVDLELKVAMLSMGWHNPVP